MGFRMIDPRSIKKARTPVAEEILDKLEGFLKSADVAKKPVEILCRFWQDQQAAITYQELREAITSGGISNETFRQWQQDYSYLVKTQLNDMWPNAMKAGAANQPLIEAIPGGFVFQTQTPGILSWLNKRGAEFVTACSQQQKDAVSALVAKKMVDSHTVDELARMIRPCIGLTEGQAKANARYYDSIVANLKKEHPRMKQESIQKKAQDAAAKYAEKQHRYRAMTIAQTESAFAYNRGADEGIRQAQAQGFLGQMMKRWSTSGDDRVCSICQGLEGVELGMDDGFDFKGKLLFAEQNLLPPAHPRCACAVEYVEVETHGEIIESPMRTGDEWIDNSIDAYDSSLVSTNGDEAMGTRLLMSHDEVKYEKDETLNVPFAYRSDRDVILYNPSAKNANDYDMKFALTHENAHRVDVLLLHSWENENFLQAMNNTESLIMSNLIAMEELLQNDDFGDDFAFNDLISSLTRGKANDMLFVGHTSEYLASDYNRSLEVFADMACIDMNDSIVRNEFNGILKELYEAYKEVVAWQGLA